MHEMALRHYDPAIARWNVIDPVVHHSMSPYNSFDNNPVFFADPGGADAEYNWDDGKYYDGGQEVSFEDAMASHGMNSDGSKKSDDDTIYKKAGTDETVEVNDGINKTIEVNHDDFETAKLYSMVIDKDRSNPNELVELYNEFFLSVNSYDGFSISALFDYILGSDPNRTVPKEMQVAVVNPIALDILTGGGTKSLKPTGWIIRSVWNKLPKSTKAKLVNALGKGIVSPTGRQGIIKLTATEAKSTGYTHKLKILGKGGDTRVYGTMGENGHIVFDKVMGH